MPLASAVLASSDPPANPAPGDHAPSPSPAIGADTPKRRRRWPWWKRIFAGLGVLLLLLVVFYQPILFAVAKIAAGKVGASQGLKIEFKPSGSIFGGLTLRDVHVTPTRPGPIEKADVGELKLSYSLPTLIRGGLAGKWLTNVEVRDVHFVYDPNKSPPEPPKKKEPFQLPAFPLPERLVLQNVNVSVRPASTEKAEAAGQRAAASAIVPVPVAPAIAQATTAVNESGLLITNFNLELLPDRPGRLHWDQLRIPSGPDFKDVNANTTYRDRNLEFTDFALDPNFKLLRLGLDASQLEQQRLGLKLDGDVFAGHATADVQLQGLGTPPRAQVQLDLADVSLGRLHDFLKLDSPLGGQVNALHLKFDGVSDKPRTWNGQFEVHARDIAASPIKIDRVDALVPIADGNARLDQFRVTQAANDVQAKAVIALPENLADLPQSSVRGDLNIRAPDFSSLPVELPPDLGLRGNFEAAGPFALEGGKLHAKLSGRARDVAVAQPDAAVAGAEFTAEVTRTLPADATAPPPAPNAPPPPPKPYFDGLQTNLQTTIRNVRYGPYLLDSLTLGLVTDGPDAQVKTLEAVRGPNRVTATARYALPAPGTDPLRQPLTADLTVDAPDLSEVSADLQTEPLAGSLAAKGHVETVNGALKGGLDLNGRNLEARGLKVQSVDGQVGIENNVVTASTLRVRLNDGTSGVDLSGTFGLDAPKPFSGKVDVNLPDLGVLAPALQANGVNQPLAGSLRVTGDASGRLGLNDADRQVNANLDVTARDLNAAGVRVAGADAKVVVANDEAVIQNGQVRFDEKNVVGLGGKVGLTGTQPFDVNTVVDFPNLAAFEPTLHANKINEPIAGSVRIEFRAAGELAPAPPPSSPIPPSLPATPADTPAPTPTDAASAANAKKPAPAVREGFAVVTARDVRVRGVRAVQSLDGRVNLADNRARVQAFVLRFDDKNSVSLDGEAGLAAPYDYRGSVAGDLNDLKGFEPLLKAFAPPPSAKPADTPKKADLSTEPAVKRKPSQTPPKPRIVSGVAVSGKNGAGGRVVTGVPAKTKEPAAASGETKLAGAVQIRWQGEGRLSPPTTDATAAGGSQISDSKPQIPEGTGTASITARGVEFNAIGPADADLGGKYTLPEPVELPTFSVRLNGIELKATLGFQHNLLRLDNLHLVQNNADLLAGYVQIPLRPGDPAGVVPDVDAIDVNVASKAIELTTLFNAIAKGQPAPAQGTVQLAVHAKGSLSKIAADVSVRARQLRTDVTVKQKLSPADADVDLNLRDNRLNLVANARQAPLQPLSVKGNVPLDLNAILRDGKVNLQSPVQLTVNLPRSDLSFLKQLSPQIAYVNGTLGADVRVSGTIENPDFAGSVDLNVPGVRANNITFPRVSDLVARIAFTKRQVAIEQFRGNVGGGTFTLGGRVDFAKLTAADARIDLALHADNVLAFRDDNTTARVNADVRVNGPFPAATVTGRVGITKSRFLKDIDIIPINLPGKPAPAPPAAAESAGPETVSVNVPPIADWKFDLAVRTDDPFLIRGNLARGQAVVDLTLKGTGAKPLLAGYVTVENLLATLPFSRLEIQNGNIQFTPDQPLNPVLDLRGTSTISERVVTVYITGRAREPKTQFTSEPPLPQEQIVALLATGSTTDELTGNTQALAGKATLLVLQDLYRRTFKPKARPNADPQPTLADKLSLDVGNVDPTTGRQEVSGRYKVTDQVQVVAGLGIQGDVTGRVKYLIRFR